VPWVQWFVFVTTKRSEIYNCLDCAPAFTLELQQKGIKYCKFKAGKNQQNQDALDKINFQYAHLVKPILGRDCLAPSLQFVGFTAKKEAAAENCREIFQNPRAKVQDFIMFAWVIVFFAKITVENKIEK